jgi:Xaa-Pro dipeptidase
MTFSQRLDRTFFERVQDRVRVRAADAGLDAVFTDDPEDV